ncbi:MAG: class I SAM-dependent methyltransferase [Chloroflexi bacterium]|nr:class I SAM-dependent methyltransferase [Chloroflexota bacterium]
MPKPESRPKICDYEGSNYRTDFWEGRGRQYEDRTERSVLRRILPAAGKRLLEIGAGFGRLTQEYHMYEQVVLVDYSLSQLQYAQQQLGRSPRFVYVAADVYRLPFRSGVFDAATMIRVIHHMADVPAVLKAIHRTLAPNALFVLEHANKRNLKAMLRYALKYQQWNPYDLSPVEFVELNFDFHPEYIRRELEKAQFEVQKQVPVSFFRLGALKNRVPTDVLVAMDNVMQRSGLLYAPSVFVAARAVGETPDHTGQNGLFVCPETGAELRLEGDTLISAANGQRWAIRDGIYDFKAPLD